MRPDARPGIDTIGFVGLGRMGWPMAHRLLAAGFDLLVHDLAAEVLDRIRDTPGVTVASGAGDLLARAPYVIAMLPDGRAVASLCSGLLDADGRAPPACTLIDMSSSDPAGTQALAAGLEAAGHRMIDAPVSGGTAGAAAGSLTILAGGHPDDVARCQPIFGALGDAVHHVGAIGSGHALKALNNLLSAANLLLGAEVVHVATRFGLDPAVALEVVNQSTGRNHATERRLVEWVRDPAFASGFRFDLMVKDVQIAQGIVRSTGMGAPVGSLVAELWGRAAAEADPEADHMAIVDWVGR